MNHPPRRRNRPTGYEGLQAKEKDIPPQGKNNLRDAVERLVKLYEAWGKPDKAAKWKNELGAEEM